VQTQEATAPRGASGGAARGTDDVGIPPCPTILTKLVKEMREDEPDFRRVAQLIGADVGLAATMLKTVNSPFYGLRAKATTVQQAVALLGLRNITQTVTGLLLANAFPVASSRLMAKFWRDSVRVAYVAAHLAAQTRMGDRQDAYTFALFRDIGVPVMLRRHRDYEEFFGAAIKTPQMTLPELEGERYGATHCELGAQLAHSWLLPDTLCEGIAVHHQYRAWQRRLAEDAPPALVLPALAFVAERLCADVQGTPAPLEWELGGASALGMLGVAEADLPGFATEAASWLAGNG
jgi:HD-like signal output (HDOD) protein